MDKPAFYTAISRTKKKCIIVSNKEDFESLQRNTKNIDKKISVFMDESNDYDLE
jgi:ATP-dependent exoDNAse (exonuclease V) alpha subunit